MSRAFSCLELLGMARDMVAFNVSSRAGQLLDISL